MSCLIRAHTEDQLFGNYHVTILQKILNDPRFKPIAVVTGIIILILGTTIGSIFRHEAEKDAAGLIPVRIYTSSGHKDLELAVADDPLEQSQGLMFKKVFLKMEA